MLHLSKRQVAIERQDLPCKAYVPAGTEPLLNGARRIDAHLKGCVVQQVAQRPAVGTSLTMSGQS